MKHTQISNLPYSFSFVKKTFLFDVLHRDHIYQTGGEPDPGEHSADD